ncbi:hypothetical protein B7982_02120 [Fibrobacter sp. UWB2]|uniref:hypothetical protein n=1 Tax=Fibrobacter sp. UWB2 TaxID=1964358 RepID=UPI000B521DEE|nr:hypothetical protein [Fibrobacter sp. UWB2]OWV24532.1 hypothetical protein B7982_02120 [Fibrobacter sp. UWB2]
MHRFYKFFFLVLAACVLLSCEQKRDEVSVDFIPGKPRLLQESLALADSMVVYNAQGLAYTTNSLKEIKKFAKAAVLDEEYVEFERNLKDVYLDEANLSVSLFQKGKLIDYLFYYENSYSWDTLFEGIVYSLQGYGRMKKLAPIYTFFKDRNVSTEGKTAEFKTRPNLPALKVNIYVDTFELKEGKFLSDTMPPREFETGLVNSVKRPCRWLLDRTFKRYYKEGFNLSVDATITFGDSGRVTNVSMDTDHPEYKDFLEEVKSILYYAWMPPEVRTQLVVRQTCPIFTEYLPPELRSRRIFGKIAAQEIVKSEKVHLSFSREYFQECNGEESEKDSIEIVGYSDVIKEHCDEIRFSKDLATGGINYLRCIQGKAKRDPLFPKKPVKPAKASTLFDRYHAMYAKEDLSLNQVVTLKIPACFEP